MDRDGKYRLALVKMTTGDPIPEKEPFFVLRARDHLAVQALREYLRLAEKDGCTEYHLQGITDRIAVFQTFALEHPQRMKQPG